MREGAARSEARGSAPPDHVTLVYREVGKTHVFTAQGLKGFHVGSCTLDAAFKLALTALGEHVSLLCGREVKYEAATALRDFKQHLKGDDILAPFVVANRLERLAA